MYDRPVEPGVGHQPSGATPGRLVPGVSVATADADAGLGKHNRSVGTCICYSSRVLHWGAP
jgi:hypothetical protein